MRRALRKLRLTLDPAFEVPHIAEDLLIRIKGGDLLADAMQHGQRLAMRANQDLGKRQRQQRVGRVDRGRRRLIQPVIQRIGDNSDDREPSVASSCGQPNGMVCLPVA